MKTVLALGAVLLSAAVAAAQPPTTAAPPAAGAAVAQAPAQVQPSRNMGGGNCSANIYNCADTPNPLPAPNTVWLEEMTWMDVRDALKAGKTTAIIATGGMEPNGPWLVTGKHNYVLKANCEAIARKLENAVCLPIIKWVPEGSIDPPSSHMTSPGTISLREATFRSFLVDVVHSLKVHGFKNIILIGDSGGNGSGMGAVADSLNRLWGGKNDPVVAHIADHYSGTGGYGRVGTYMETRGVVEGQSDNMHDDPIITLNMFITDPSSVRWAERVKADKATINGFSIADRGKSLELARQVVDFRATQTAASILAAIANKGVVATGRGRGGGGNAAAGAAGGAAGGGGGRAAGAGGAAAGGGGRAAGAAAGGAAAGGAAGAAGGNVAAAGGAAGGGGRAGRGGGRGGAAGGGAAGGAAAGGAAAGGAAAGAAGGAAGGNVAAAGGAAGGGGRGGGRGGAAAPTDPNMRNMGGGTCSQNPYNCAGVVNPIPTPNTVWIEEMTWIDVRDALKAGKTTAIISTGGIEPNGPWLVLGKHNYVLQANCDNIARRLGDALCAPILPYVPEGRIEPPSGHMLSPGTISLREDTFRSILIDIAMSLKAHGFKNIILIGDSGGNTNGMAAVADSMTKLWAGTAQAIHVPEYYTSPPGSRNVLREQGVTRDSMPSDGLHDSPGITLNMMLADPSSVRWAERVKTDQAVINGVSIADLGRSLELAKMISDERSRRTADLIKQKIAARR